MLEKENYLYWLNESEPKFKQDIVYREMYSRISLIFHILQMIEYNIANILALENFEKEFITDFVDDIECIRKNIDKKFKELSKLSIGILKRQVEKSNYLREINFEKLNEFVDYRNYLPSRCFKEKLFNN